jgi:hypothetical protein
MVTGARGAPQLGRGGCEPKGRADPRPLRSVLSVMRRYERVISRGGAHRVTFIPAPRPACSREDPLFRSRICGLEDATTLNRSCVHCRSAGDAGNAMFVTVRGEERMRRHGAGDGLSSGSRTFGLLCP